MGILERWIDWLHTVATGSKKRRILLTPIGMMLFASFTALVVLFALRVDRWLGLPRLLPERAGLWAGIPVTLAGMAAAAWSLFHFLKVKGTPVPFNPPPKLITSGPYRYVRNPMLTGVFLILLGLGLGVHSFSLVFLFTPIFVVMNVWELKRIEEPELVRRFGNAYTAYRTRTPMFIPGRRPKLTSKRPL